jgi:hypothetical protein
MSIAIIHRGGAHGTGINHQKQNNQRELDVHAQCERRRQDVLPDKELTDNAFDLAFIFKNNYPLARTVHSLRKRDNSIRGEKIV